MTLASELAQELAGSRAVTTPSHGSDLTVQLALSLALRLRLAGQSEVGEVELGTLCVRSEQLRLLGVQEGEGLGARPVSLHTHLRLIKLSLREALPVFY